MLLKTLTHRHGEGWLAPLPGELDSPNTLVLAFGASGYAQHPAALQELAAAFPQSVLVGCSTAGEIAGEQVSDASISVAVARFDHTQLRRALTDSRRPDRLGRRGRAPRRAAARPRPARGVRAVRRPARQRHAAGRRDSPPRCRRACTSPAAWPATAAASPAPGSSPARGRCRGLVRRRPVRRAPPRRPRLRRRLVRLRPRARVTRSDGNILYELDGKPALELYKSYLGECADGLPGTACCSRWRSRAEAPSATRGAHDPRHRRGRQSLTFAGDMPEAPSPG